MTVFVCVSEGGGMTFAERRVSRDAAVVADTADSGCTYHGYNGTVEGKPIDFILVNDQVTEVKSYNIMREKYNDRYVSDHYPIFADMTF